MHMEMREEYRESESGEEMFEGGEETRGYETDN